MKWASSLTFGFALVVCATTLYAQPPEDPGVGEGSCGNCAQSSCPPEYRLMSPASNGEYGNVNYSVCAMRSDCNLGPCSGGGDEEEMLAIAAVFSPEDSAVDVPRIASLLALGSGRVRLASDGAALLMSCDQTTAIRRISLTTPQVAAITAALTENYANAAFVAFQEHLQR